MTLSPQRPVVLLPPLGALAQQLTAQYRTELERSLGKGVTSTAPCDGIAEQLFWAVTGQLGQPPVAQAMARKCELPVPMQSDGVWLQPVLMATGMSDVTIHACPNDCSIPDQYADELIRSADTLGIQLQRAGKLGFLAVAEPGRVTHFTAPDMAMEQSLLDAMPSGDGAGVWHQLINESQVLARHHNVQGFNSLWPWGQGRWPGGSAAQGPAGEAIDPTLTALLDMLSANNGEPGIYCLAGIDGKLLVEESVLAQHVAAAIKSRGSVIFADGPQVRFDRWSFWRRKTLPLIDLREYRCR